MKLSVTKRKEKSTIFMEKRGSRKMNKEKVKVVVDTILTLIVSLVEDSDKVAVDREVIIILVEAEEGHLAATSSNITRTYLKIQMLRNLICKQCSNSIEERKFGLFCTIMYLKKKVKI
jgi:hypothetical protein